MYRIRRSNPLINVAIVNENENRLTSSPSSPYFAKKRKYSATDNTEISQEPLYRSLPNPNPSPSPSPSPTRLVNRLVDPISYFGNERPNMTFVGPSLSTNTNITNIETFHLTNQTLNNLVYVGQFNLSILIAIDKTTNRIIYLDQHAVCERKLLNYYTENFPINTYEIKRRNDYNFRVVFDPETYSQIDFSKVEREGSFKIVITSKCFIT